MRPEHLNLRHLRAFAAVARRGSISAASGEVHLSQPAMTQAIAKLEAQLAQDLFTRHATGMLPTEAGHLLLARAERALCHLREGARSAVRVGDQRGRGVVDLDQRVTAAQLRALVAVGEHGNFSLAARAVGVSQPSLHRQARDLERLAGVPFYGKVVQGVELTLPAQQLARHARLAFAELDQAFEELDAARGVDSARLALGTLPLARTAILPRAINALAERRPEVLVRVVDGPYDDLLHGLRHGALDLVVGALREPVPIDDVVQEELVRDRLSVVARYGHPLSGRRRLSIADLAAYPWAVPRSGPPARAQFDALFERARLKSAGQSVPAGLVETSSLVLIRGLLLGSDRLTLISARQVQHEVRAGLLEVLPFDLPQTERPIGLTVRRGWQPTATQTLFLDLVRTAARQDYSEIE